MPKRGQMADIELSSLRQKVREQASRLRELETFRQLSEEPLASLSLPSTLASPAELLDAYSSVYARLQEAKRHNTELEDSLRTEVLQSEKQRALIEVLKQHLEAQGADCVGEKSTKLTPRQTQTTARGRGAKAAELQQALTDLLRTSQSLDRLQADLKATKSQLEAAEKRISVLEKENEVLSQAAEQKSSVEKQYELLQDTHKRLMVLFEQVQSEANAAGARVFALQSDVKDLEIVKGECAKVKSQTTTLELELLHVKNERDSLRFALDSCKAAKADAETENKVLSDQLRLVKQLKDAAESGADQAKESLLVAKTDITHMKSRLAASEKQLSQSQAMVHELQTKVEESNAVQKQAQREAKDTRKDYEFISLEQTRLKSMRETESVALNEQINRQRKEIATLRTQLESIKGQATALKSETWLCRHSLKALDRTRSSEDQLRRELSDARKTLSEYREEISALSNSAR